MDLNKHIVKNDNNKPYHSSGYAIIAHGDRIGSTSTESFNQRQQINQERKVIDGYHRSNIGRTYGALKARSVAGDKLSIPRLNNRPNQAAPYANKGMPTRRFVEPNSQKYNPYA